MIDLSKPVQIAQDLWWVGSESTHEHLQCNPYLYIHGNSAILFDPGSILDGQTVLEKVQSLISIDRIEAIVLSHQDPDLCMAIPFFEKAGFTGVLCCHERSQLIIQYYGFSSPYYLVNHHSYSYVMKTGKALGFIFTPYLHFPGAIMSYLPEQNALISGDVFGSITADWNLYAEDNYLDGMIAYHEMYMPSHEILASTMETLKSYSIGLICPQHGSVITKDIEQYIATLMNIPCGLFLDAQRTLTFQTGGVRSALDILIKRLITVYGAKEVRELFKNSPFKVDVRTQKLTKSMIRDESIWESFFIFLEERKGIVYLSALASLAERLSKENSLALPPIFSSLLFTREQAIEESQAQLKEVQNKLQQLEQSMYRDAITNLYNQEFYETYLKKELADAFANGTELIVLLLSIDNLERINLDYGSAEGDKTMRILAQLLLSSVDAHVQICRLSGGIFALLCSHLTGDDALARAIVLRNRIAEEERFIVPITVSMGMFASNEIPSEIRSDLTQSITRINQTALFRLRLAKKQGGGELVYSSSSKAGSRSAVTILLIDNQGFDRDLLTQALEKERYRVLTADNGLIAKHMIEESPPDLIIAELLIPKLSALTLRKELLKQPSLGSIPFLLISINKNEKTISRAFELGIQHFLKRPVARFELVGLANLLLEKGG